MSKSNREMPDIPPAISTVMGIHVLAIEWLCEQLSDETGGSTMQWKVSAFTQGVNQFNEMTPDALKAVTSENLTMAEEAFNA
ncbi:MAG: hypothetical protein WBA57_21470 [Elainellaceae cyanobacterium]